MTHAPAVPGRFLGLLGERIARVRTVLCLGIDPDPSQLPVGFRSDVTGVEAFARLLLEAAARHAAAVKVNLAFFEAYGSAGSRALERLRAEIPRDVPFVADAKRGDIGSTAGRQVAAIFDGLDADAVTVNPYLGSEALGAFLGRVDRFAYVLCRTSNPGAGEFQDLQVASDGRAGFPAEPLYLRVARRASLWGHGAPVGLVVAATAPRELRMVREVAPELPFLVPGIGVQGGDLAAVLEDGPVAGSDGPALLVNVSRGIAGAAREAPDPATAIEEAAREWSRRLEVLR